MPSLHELQTDLMQAVLDGRPEQAAPTILQKGIAPERRLEVYANNARVNFTDSLRSSFPAIWRLVGADYFRQCAARFQQRQPSRSGDLQNVGTLFPRFLAELHAAGEFRYLGDVARLERLCEEALLAADHDPFDFGKLARVAAAAYDDLCFHLHPAARLFTSEYPCLRIWEENAAGDSEPEMIDLAAGPDRLLLTRAKLRLVFYRLSPGEHAFLRALQNGEAFRAAVEGGNGCDAEFDAGAALRRFVLAEAIVDFQ